jgi:hypothetical protein
MGALSAIDHTFYWRPADYAAAIIVADGLTWHGEGEAHDIELGTDYFSLPWLVTASFGVASHSLLTAIYFGSNRCSRNPIFRMSERFFDSFSQKSSDNITDIRGALEQMDFRSCQNLLWLEEARVHRPRGSE